MGLFLLQLDQRRVVVQVLGSLVILVLNEGEVLGGQFNQLVNDTYNVLVLLPGFQAIKALIHFDVLAEEPGVMRMNLDLRV